MPFLTEEETANIWIERMILHVVGGDEAFEAQPEIADLEQAPFFVERVKDTDIAPVYEFLPESQTKTRLERIARDDDSFEAGAQALSRDFSRLHVGSSRDGAFFIFELGVDDDQTRIYSLVKYDYREAIEQTDGEDGNLFRRIIHAFVADRRAMQKSCLVRVRNGETEPIIAARDRVAPGPAIGDYFANFLEVKRIRTDQELNRDTAEAVRKTLTESREWLPGQDVSRALQHAKAVLRDRQQISEEAVAEAVLAAAGDPEDEDVRTELLNRTARKLRAAKLDGLTFRPDRQVLRKPPIRRLRTTEGVRLEYPDAADNGIVRRERRADGGETITIHTDQVTEDQIVRDRAG